MNLIIIFIICNFILYLIIIMYYFFLHPILKLIIQLLHFIIIDSLINFTFIHFKIFILLIIIQNYIFP